MLTCTRCLVQVESMPACKSCNIPYCSKECQTKDWKRHKQECSSRPAPSLSRTRAQLQIWMDHKEKIGALTLLGNLLLLPQDTYKSCYLDVTVRHDGNLGFYIPRIIPLPIDDDESCNHDSKQESSQNKVKQKVAVLKAANLKEANPNHQTLDEKSDKTKSHDRKTTKLSDSETPISGPNGIFPMLTSTQIEANGEKKRQNAIFGVRIQHLVHMADKHPDFFKCVRQHLNEQPDSSIPKMKEKNEIFLLMHCDLGGDLPSQIMMTTIKAYPVNSIHAEAMHYYSTYGPLRLIEKFNRNENMLDFNIRKGRRDGGRARITGSENNNASDPFFREFQEFLEGLARPTQRSLSIFT